MTGPVSPLSPADRAWADLGAELTPAKSLVPVDAVTARAVTTIIVVGVLLGSLCCPVRVLVVVMALSGGLGTG